MGCAVGINVAGGGADVVKAVGRLLGRAVVGLSVGAGEPLVRGGPT